MMAVRLLYAATSGSAVNSSAIKDGSLRPPSLQSFNTEVTVMLRALRVEG